MTDCLPAGREYRAAVARVARAASANGYMLIRTPSRTGQVYTLHDGATLRSVTVRVYLADIQKYLRDRGVEA